MRILHVFEPTSGGVPTYVEMLARAQTVQGAEVMIGGPPDWRPTVPAVQVSPLRWHRRRSARQIFAMRDLRALVARYRPDVVHLHSFFAGLLRQVPLPSLAPVMYQPHGWAFLSGHPVRDGVVARVERYLSRMCHRVLALNEAEVVAGCRVGLRCPIRTIGSAADDIFLLPVPSAGSRKLARRCLGLDPAWSVLLVCGRLCHQKGQDRILAEIDSNPELLPSNAQLLFVGDTGDRLASALKRATDKVGGRIRFDGAVPRELLREYYQAADALLLPSRWDGLSLAMLEALASGCPVVATDVGGAREVLSRGCGEVVLVDEIGRLLKQGLLRATDQALRQREALAGRQLVESEMSPARLAERSLEFYAELGVGLS